MPRLIARFFHFFFLSPISPPASRIADLEAVDKQSDTEQLANLLELFDPETI